MKLKLLLIITAAPILLLCQMPMASTNGHSGYTYVAPDGGTYAWYTATTPSAIYDADSNKTWLAWEAWDGDYRVCRIAVYDHSARNWSLNYRVGNSSMSNDDHGVPAMTRDGDGYWHVFYGAHSSAFKHGVSVAPDVPSQWTITANIGSSGSYPHPTAVGGAIYLFYRDDTDLSDRPLVLQKTTSLSSGTAVWGSKQTIADFGADSRWYSGNHILVGSEIHMVATRSNSADQWRRDVYYLRYNTTTGAVSNVDGTTSTAAGSLPLDLATLNSSYRIVSQPHASGSGNIPAFTIDEAGDPHVLYMDGANDGDHAYDVWHTAYTSGSWTSPYKVGTSYTNGSGFTITRSAGGGVSAYWTQQAGGTPAWYPGSGDRSGGDIWTATRSSGGTWSASRLVQSANAYPLGEPNAVQNGRIDARVVWAENTVDPADSNAGHLRIYAFGDSGYLLRKARRNYTVVAWDQQYKSSQLVLADTNTSATMSTNAGDSSRAQTRADATVKVGSKAYFEIVANVVVGTSGTSVFGFANTGHFVPTFGYPGKDSNSFGCFSDGTCYINDVLIGTIPAYASGDRFGVAIDHSSHKVWIRKNGGTWNNDGSADPATGVGGFDISSIAGNLYPIVGLWKATEKFTAYFGPSGWTSAAPQSFTAIEQAWPL